MTSFLNLRVLLISACAAFALGTAADSAAAQMCSLRTVVRVPELEFWGPDAALFQLHKTDLVGGMPAPGETFVSPTIGYSFAYPQGKVDQPLIVFTHGGFPGDFDSYCELLLHTVTHGYAVLFVQKMATATTIEEYVADVRAVLHHVLAGGDPAIPLSVIGAPGVNGLEWTAAGHSWGGATALYVAQDTRFSRIISFEPMEGQQLLGDASLTEKAVKCLPQFTGDLFIVTGSLDYITSPANGPFWYQFATNARRRCIIELQGAGHYGPMSLTLILGGTDPLFHSMVLPDTISFPSQLRVHKRIMIAATRSHPTSGAGPHYHLFGKSMRKQLDHYDTPFDVSIHNDFENPVGWAVHDAGELVIGLMARPGDHMRVEWSFASGPWAPLAEWPARMGPSGNFELGIPVPASLIPLIAVRGIVTRGGATLMTPVLTP